MPTIYKQTGKRLDTVKDYFIKAKLPGWRISRTGHRYFEARKNRTDKAGSRL